MGCSLHLASQSGTGMLPYKLGLVATALGQNVPDMRANAVCQLGLLRGYQHRGSPRFLAATIA